MDHQRSVAHKLGALLGDRRGDLEVTHRASDRHALSALVADAVRRPAEVAGTAAKSAGGSRARRRVDLLNVAVAGLAAVAVATTAVVGAVQAATASPADDALQALAADEKTIASAEATLADARQQIAGDVAEADARAEALRAALPPVATAPNPADIPPGETEVPDAAGRIDIIDPAALEKVSASIDTYRGELAGIALPPLPEPYEHSTVDDDSLVDVGAAIDRAQQHLADVDRLTAELRETRAQLRDHEAAFAAQLGVFAGSFRTAAEKVIAEHPDATSKYKDAVTTAVGAVAAADLRTDSGRQTLAQYRDAVFALVGSQVYANRVREEQRQREERERAESEQEQRPSVPGGRPSPTQPPPEEPKPTEPEPSQSPTGPGDGGGTGAEGASR
ncbi:hypothetical protein [Microbacterium sp. nov. GSS16]|uniref:hypothetical protein n=1 Tax=Microbacterium sp. nov. GSS16 TaxID=3019890 RepID=UPI00230694AC|nr:hypothetical protein [Microbacterium sp. nov. GSS16]WCD92900.1 hypothetical protein PGB26_01075 [Microbacterium sp. nov. GSS16]